MYKTRKMRQRREIPIHIFELAYATVCYEPFVDARCCDYCACTALLQIAIISPYSVQGLGNMLALNYTNTRS